MARPRLSRYAQTPRLPVRFRETDALISARNPSLIGSHLQVGCADGISVVEGGYFSRAGIHDGRVCSSTALGLCHEARASDPRIGGAEI